MRGARRTKLLGPSLLLLLLFSNVSGIPFTAAWTAAATRTQPQFYWNHSHIGNSGTSGAEWQFQKLKKLYHRRPGPRIRCKGGLDLLLNDLGLLSVLVTSTSLKLHTIALTLAKLLTWTVHVPTVFIKRLPLILRDILELLGAEIRLPEPLERIRTSIFLVDNLFNVLVVVPTQITIDFIAFVGLIFGYAGLKLDKTASYPQKFTKVVRQLGLERLIDETYGCGHVTPDKAVELVLNKIFGRGRDQE